METTFKIEGPSKKSPGATAVGTVFVVARTSKTTDGEGCWTLVTAGHVLDDIAGDSAVLHMRVKNGDGSFKKALWRFALRNQGKDLYIKHASADAAAMDFDYPNEALPTTAINTRWFATDEFVRELEIHPGDELLSLGFPLSVEANDAGFPILRSGKIASYPILPTRNNPILFEFNVFGGNSGGPVYLSYANRVYNRTTNFMIHQKLFGLVVQQIYGATSPRDVERLGVSVIVPAPILLDLISTLPDIPSKPNQPARPGAVPANVEILKPN